MVYQPVAICRSFGHHFKSPATPIDSYRYVLVWIFVDAGASNNTVFPSDEYVLIGDFGMGSVNSFMDENSVHVYLLS
jgi:hypothetical protein